MNGLTYKYEGWLDGLVDRWTYMDNMEDGWTNEGWMDGITLYGKDGWTYKYGHE